MRDNIITKPITPGELREQVLKNSKEIMAFFETDDMRALLSTYAPVLYKRTFEKYRRLQTLEYRIAVAAGQSAGKSSVTNAFVLEYPLLPFCDIATTCVPTVIRYGGEIKIEVTVQEVIENNGKNKLKDIRSFSVPCSKGSLKEGLFKKLVDYFAICREVLALGNVTYFTKRPMKEYENSERKITAADLTLNENDPKHVAMLLLTAMCAYMQNNEEEEVLSQTHIESRTMQQELLRAIGLKDDEKCYTVTVYWDSPLLKKGLVFYDLPGLGSDNISQNGYLSHKDITEMALEEVQSMLYIFKKEVDAAGLDAVAQMLNTEAIRDLKSKQDRVVVALNKVDGLDPTQIKVSVGTAEVSLKKFNLEPKIYPISALTYGEKRYVDNGIIDSPNTFTANQCMRIRNGKIVVTQDIDDVLEFNNEDYPGEPFLKALNDYADNSVVTNSLEFVRSLYMLVEEAADELKSLIDLYSATSGNVSETNVIIKSALENLLNQILTNFVTNANQKIDKAFEDFGDGRFQEADDELISGLNDEIKELREKSYKAAKSNLEKNINGNVVLYYLKKKKGREYKEYVNPNYSNWVKLNNRIKNFQFAKPFSKYTTFLKRVVNEIREKYSEIDADIIESLTEEFDKIDKEITKTIELTKKKLREKIEENSKSDEQTELIYENSVKFLEQINDQFRNYVLVCLNDIEANIGSQDTLDELTQTLVDDVKGNQDALNEVFKEITKSFAEKLEHFGTWRTHTYCVNKAEMLKTIETVFVLTKAHQKMYIDTINPKLPVKKGCIDAADHKKKALNAPLNILNNRITYMITVLDPSNSSEIGAIEALERKNFAMLKELRATVNTGIGIEYAVNQIKNQPEYKNELKNIEDVNFSMLLSGFQDMINDLQSKEGLS